jgi:hypothetical protein
MLHAARALAARGPKQAARGAEEPQNSGLPFSFYHGQTRANADSLKRHTLKKKFTARSKKSKKFRGKRERRSLPRTGTDQHGQKIYLKLQVRSVRVVCG